MGIEYTQACVYSLDVLNIYWYCMIHMYTNIIFFLVLNIYVSRYAYTHASSFQHQKKGISLKKLFQSSVGTEGFHSHSSLSSHQSCIVFFNTMDCLDFVPVLSGFNLFPSQQCNKCNLHHFLFSLKSPMNTYTTYFFIFTFHDPFLNFMF